MKALRTVLSLAIFGSILAFSGCGGKGGNSEPISDKQLGLLSKTWKIKDPSGNSVLLGSVDSTAHWTNFQLTISGTKGQTTFNYTCTGRPPRSVWESAGTWSFGTDPATQIVRDDQAAITYTVDAAGKNLQLTFSYSGGGYTNRVGNVSGAWTFNLIPTN